MKAPREEKENPRALPPLELSAALEYNPGVLQPTRGASLAFSETLSLGPTCKISRS